ncbi:hypothetical protein ACF08O_25260 [Streptomyces paradoxus]|uniref:hypothetical protein n=1 Tax=Streptomyces paradoxus TaxID=66375 RepID=UPI0036FCEA69
MQLFDGVAQALTFVLEVLGHFLAGGCQDGSVFSPAVYEQQGLLRPQRRASGLLVLMPVEEVAAAALYLAVEATFTTGLELPVDEASAKASAHDRLSPVVRQGGLLVFTAANTPERALQRR